MKHLPKFLLIFVLIVFVLACNFVTQPIENVQNVAGTAESIASSMPIETLQALATNMPVQTLEALSSAIPDLENLFNPQGEPVDEWNGIPIMPQATAGQESTDLKTYSFKVDATVQEVQDFYADKLVGLGWSQSFSMPGADEGTISVYSKDSNLLTLTIASIEGTTVAVLTLT